MPCGYILLCLMVERNIKYKYTEGLSNSQNGPVISTVDVYGSNLFFSSLVFSERLSGRLFRTIAKQLKDRSIIFAVNMKRKSLNSVVG